jgi:hypothetical protein
MTENTFLPIDYDWSWIGQIHDQSVYSELKSGAHSLPNGSFIICEYTRAIIFEINKHGEILWEYRNPVGVEIYSEYTVLDGSSIFRGEKYPPDYLGFDGKDLTSQGIIENTNSNSDACILVDIENQTQDLSSTFIHNPVYDGQIIFNKTISANIIKIIDLQGKTCKTIKNFYGNSIQTDLKPGIYLVQIFEDDNLKAEKIIVQ